MAPRFPGVLRSGPMPSPTSTPRLPSLPTPGRMPVGAPWSQFAHPIFRGPDGVRPPVPPAHPQSTPIVMFATATVPASGSASPNLKALENHTGKPVEIFAVRFHLHGPDVATTLLGIEVSLASGPASIAHSVPIGCLDRSRDLPSVERSFTTGNTDASFVSSSDFEWLPRDPIPLAPGHAMGVKFASLGFTTSDVTVDVTLIGRTAPDLDVSRAVVPYAVAWKGSPVDMRYVADHLGDASYVEDYSSTELDLANSTDSDVRLSLLTGRLVSFSPVDLGYFANDNVNAVIDSLFFARLRASSGGHICRNYTPFRSLYGLGDRATDIDLILHPGEFLVSEVQAQMGGLAALASGDVPQFYSPVVPMVGMIGSRTVNLGAQP